MKKYFLSHLRGSIEIFCFEIAGKVVLGVLFDGQSILSGSDLLVYFVIAIVLGAGRWPLLDSDDALLHVVPER